VNRLPFLVLACSGHNVDFIALDNAGRDQFDDCTPPFRAVWVMTPA